MTPGHFHETLIVCDGTKFGGVRYGPVSDAIFVYQDIEKCSGLKRLDENLNIIHPSFLDKAKIFLSDLDFSKHK